MNKCQQCTDECQSICAKDEDNYKPERALQWLGVTVIAWCVVFMWWALS